ncbi:MAG: polysaccharide deacetylase [Myxococcales bacterium FL481]|nr:MAG: polysaccharide deacetylase [Myxococcales bacterium FL481]
MSTTDSTLVSVDLDDLACYHAIHGLRETTAHERSLVLERCLPRLLELFERTEVRATFFVIGRDLERDLAAGGTGAQCLRRAVEAGHELANHSFAHDYAMTTWSSAAMYRDLARCDRLLRQLGARPRGFRAPGYIYNDTLLAQVAALGYTYDSSSLPSPAYYVAKRLKLASMRQSGRRSASARHGVSSFFGSPRAQYLPHLALWEVPIGVTPTLRLPLIGTALFGGPRRLAASLRDYAKRVPFLHLQLHGLDLGDEQHDGYDPALVELAPEFRMPFATRLRELEALLVARGPASPIGSALG